MKWRKRQSEQHILRSQLGFGEAVPSRPKPCQGCVNYHGLAYGYTTANRTVLICGFHPYGWQADSLCPDRQDN